VCVGRGVGGGEQVGGDGGGAAFGFGVKFYPQTQT